MWSSSFNVIGFVIALLLVIAVAALVWIFAPWWVALIVSVLFAPFAFAGLFLSTWG